MAQVTKVTELPQHDRLQDPSITKDTIEAASTETQMALSDLLVLSSVMLSVMNQIVEIPKSSNGHLLYRFGKVWALLYSLIKKLSHNQVKVPGQGRTTSPEDSSITDGFADFASSIAQWVTESSFDDFRDHLQANVNNLRVTFNDADITDSDVCADIKNSLTNLNYTAFLHALESRFTETATNGADACQDATVKQWLQRIAKSQVSCNESAMKQNSERIENEDNILLTSDGLRIDFEATNTDEFKYDPSVIEHTLETCADGGYLLKLTSESPLTAADDQSPQVAESSQAPSLLLLQFLSSGVGSVDRFQYAADYQKEAKQLGIIETSPEDFFADEWLYEESAAGSSV